MFHQWYVCCERERVRDCYSNRDHNLDCHIEKVMTVRQSRHQWYVPSVLCLQSDTWRMGWTVTVSNVCVNTGCHSMALHSHSHICCLCILAAT